MSCYFKEFLKDSHLMLLFFFFEKIVFPLPIFVKMSINDSSSKWLCVAIPLVRYLSFKTEYKYSIINTIIVNSHSQKSTKVSTKLTDKNRKGNASGGGLHSQ